MSHRSIALLLSLALGVFASAAHAQSVLPDTPPFTREDGRAPADRFGGLLISCPAETTVAGAIYSSSLGATGGTPPYVFSVGGLPQGLKFDSNTGQIVGTPSIPGTYVFVSTVIDATPDTSTTECRIVVMSQTQELAVACPTDTGRVAQEYSSALVASGGTPPYRFAIDTPLQTGLDFVASTGVIYGFPQVSGTVNFTAYAIDAVNDSASISCSITIAAAPLNVLCPAVATALIGQPYSSTLLATGGTTPYTFAADSLPPGLTIDTQTGAITGTPTATGEFQFVARVTDAAKATSSSPCAITIVGNTLTVACPADSGRVAELYNSALVASGGTPPYRYAIDTALQTGLDFDANTGAIEGFPQVDGTVNFTAYAIDALNDSASISCSITIGPQALTLVCPTTTVGRVGVSFSAQLQARGGVPTYVFALESPLPDGLQLDPNTGVISGIPTLAAQTSYQVRAVDFAADTARASCVITIEPQSLVIACPDSSSGRVGVPYSSGFVVGGGIPPYTFSILGSLPAGLELDANTGTISGTPTVAGSESFDIQVRDTTGQTAIAECSITILPGFLVVGCPDSTTVRVGVFYADTLSVTGGVPPYRFVPLDSLPPGLSLSSSGVLSGTPTQAGTRSYSVAVFDSSEASSGEVQCSITILPSETPTLALACPDTANGRVGTPYSSTLRVSGGTPPYTFSLAGGALPPGLELDGDTGRIHGTPTQDGSFTHVTRVVDAALDSAIVQCQIDIAGAPAGVTLACADTTTGSVGVPFRATMRATGGAEPYSFAIIAGDLPPGLDIHPNFGVISGTPTLSGTFVFTTWVTSADSSTDSVTCSITIEQAGEVLALACPDSTRGQIGVPFSTSLRASGGTLPYTFTLESGQLPPGLTLNPSTGVISGTPTTAGAFGFRARVRDAAQDSALITCNIRIVAPLSIACPDSATGRVGQGFAARLLVDGGRPLYTVAIVGGALPAGLRLGATGLIFGTPTTVGSSSFTARVLDTGGDSAFVSCTITILPAVLELSLECPSVQRGEVGVPFSSALIAVGGRAPYAFSIVAGALPAGLDLNGSTGTITGTPTTAGTALFTALVVDSNADSVTVRCFIDVLGGGTGELTVLCPEARAGEVGVPYRSRVVVRGGTPPFEFEIAAGTLPAGLAIDQRTGAITGRPTAAGSFPFTIQVADSAGDSASAQCRIDVRDQQSACTDITPAVTELWPPNHKLVPIPFNGLEGRRFTITNVTQDEPRGSGGSGKACADAVFQNGTLYLRAERAGHSTGRVYTITFRATDPLGGVCMGSAQVCVPHDRGRNSTCKREALAFSSFGTCPSRADAELVTETLEFGVRVVQSSATGATFEYALPADTEVDFAVYDIGGRRVGTLERSQRTAGTYTAVWNAAGTPGGMYFYRLRAGDQVRTGALPLVK